MAAPDARALTADNESISAADYRTLKRLPRQCLFRIVTGKAFPIKGGCTGKTTSSGGRLCAACEADKKRQTAVGAVDVSADSDKATKIWLTDRSGRYVPALELLFSAEGKGQTIRKTLL